MRKPKNTPLKLKSTTPTSISRMHMASTDQEVEEGLKVPGNARNNRLCCTSLGHSKSSDFAQLVWWILPVSGVASEKVCASSLGSIFSSSLFQKCCISNKNVSIGFDGSTLYFVHCAVSTVQ